MIIEDMRKLLSRTISLSQVVLLIVLCACRRDGPIVEEGNITISGGHQIVIGCEGNYQFGNASLSLYQYSNSEITSNLFESVNARKLGDVCQSLTAYEEKIFAVINNSGKIEVFSRNDFSSMGTIEGLKSPRYCEVVNRNTAFVSDYKANAVYRIDLNRMKVMDSIAISSWTEGLLAHSGKLYVCGKSSGYLYKIGLESLELEDSIALGAGPSGLLLDADDQLWVLCEGNYGDPRPCSLSKVELQNFTIVQTYEFPVNQQIAKLNISSDGKELYYLGAGVFKMSTTTEELPNLPFVDLTGRNPYGLGIDFSNEQIWVADAKDFISKSSILKFDSTGTLLQEGSGGVNASSFLFLY